MKRKEAMALLAFGAVRLFAGKKVIVPGGAARGALPLSPAIEAGDFVYVSGMVGRDSRGQFARGDVKAQTRRTLENVGAALEAAGLNFAHIVSTNLYLSDIRHLPAADGAYREFFRDGFPARTTLEAVLMNPDAMVEVSAIAIRDAGRKRLIHPAGWPAPRSCASYAMEAGDTLFLSALQPVDARSSKLAGDSIHLQTEQVMRNQEALLETAGMGFADLVSSRIYLAEPSDYNGLNEAYRKFVIAVPPVRATVHAYPVESGHLLQIQSVAVRGSGKARPSGDGYTSPIHSYSVAAGNRIYITGMTGRGADGQFAKGNIRAQTRQALATIDEQLARQGATFADVVDSTVWLKDARDFAGMNEVYAEIVQPNPPARSTVRIPPSAPEALVEIMMLAVR
ncbi:MAG: RidA family protein [Bryobacteraceae bacterium]